MSRIMVAWELGGGLGHLIPLVPILKKLDKVGVKLWAALRDLSRVEASWAGLTVSCLQAPHRTVRTPDRIDPLRSYAHILHNSGYSDVDELKALVLAWQHLLDLVQPDLLLADHAPTALLASRGRKMHRVVIGTGFCCPPDVTPLPDFRAWMPPATEQLVADESRVLDAINAVLTRTGLNELTQVSQLFRETDETVLMTFPELDVYDRTGPRAYYGIWPTDGGTDVAWPAVAGPRVLAYLKPFPSLPQLLQILSQLTCGAAVYMSPFDARLAGRYESSQLRFVTERVDLTAATEQCDLAILNGGHGATATMLLGGIPSLQIPLNLEQLLNGKSVERIGAGLVARADDPVEIAQKLSELLRNPQYADSARRFAECHGTFDPDASVVRICHRLEQLAR